MSLKYRTSAGTSASNFTDLVVKVGDTLPIGTEVDYDGQSVPAGWQEVDDPNVYSTTETKVGTWIDGKPLYRKVFETGVLSTSELSLLTITNEQIKTINGWLCKDTGVAQPYGQFYNADSTYTSRVFSDGSYVKVQQNAIYQSNNYKARVIIEYTKTTD